MPKRSFNSIKSASDLKFSNVYGSGLKMPVGLNDPAFFRTLHSSARGIQGYTGYHRIHKPAEEKLEMRRMSRNIPGYTGFLPGVESETVFGKTHGVVASATSNTR